MSNLFPALTLLDSVSHAHRFNVSSADTGRHFVKMYDILGSNYWTGVLLYITKYCMVIVYTNGLGAV